MPTTSVLNPLSCHSLSMLFMVGYDSSVSFGKSFGCLDNIEQEIPYAVSFDDLTEIVSQRLKDPAWPLRERLTGVDKKVQYHKNVIRGYALDIIEKRRREGFCAPRKDLLQWFLEAKDEEGKPLSDDLLVDYVLSFSVMRLDLWIFQCLFPVECVPHS